MSWCFTTWAWSTPRWTAPSRRPDALDKVLAESAGPLNPSQRRQAQRARDEQAARVAQVLVVTNVPATIEIDGMQAGHTPLPRPLRVASGAHVVSGVAPGFLASRQEVTLAGQVTGTVTLTLQPSEASIAHLALTTSVLGAEVLVNDKLVGRTPLPGSVAVPSGSVRVEVRRGGYRTATRTMHLDDGANGTLDLNLDEDPAALATVKGGLLLAISEPGAEASIDGVPKTLATEGRPLSVVSGPHVLRIQRLGFEPFEQRIEITAGQDTSLAVHLVPTLETEARYQDSAHSRRLVGWSLAAGGALIAAGAVVFAVLTRHDVANAQDQVNQRLVVETIPNDMTHHCFYDPSSAPSGEYVLNKCGETKQFYQDQLNSKKLYRDLGYGAVGLGGLLAGVGTYLIATSSPEKYRNQPAARISLWNDGQSGGLMVFGQF